MIIVTIDMCSDHLAVKKPKSLLTAVFGKVATGRAVHFPAQAEKTQ
jgi:hypothetical protein